MEDTKNILLLLKLDSKHLFERIKYRMPEYLSAFALKRTRTQFQEVFKNRYDAVEICDLKNCSEDFIVAVDAFYCKTDDIKWYLDHTEDMPTTVEQKLHSQIKQLYDLFITLQEIVDRDMGPKKEIPPETLPDFQET